MKYVSSFTFAAYTQSESGVGSQVIFIPRNSVLEHVTLPDVSQTDIEIPSQVVTFEYNGKQHTASLEEFLDVGACRKVE